MMIRELLMCALSIILIEREKETNGDEVVMGSTPTFELRDI